MADRQRREFEYVRHGTALLVAAFDIDTGQAFTEIIVRNDADTFIAFLHRLDQLIEPGRDVHVVLDNGTAAASVKKSCPSDRLMSPSLSTCDHGASNRPAAGYGLRFTAESC